MPTEISDKYDVIRVLHQSAATAVYLIRHKTLGAIRVLKSCKKDDSQASELLTEANLLSGMKFSGIPTIYDYYEDSTTEYLVEEYVNGTPLSEKLSGKANIDIQEAIDIICGVLDILDNFHTREHPIIYRDLKPEHIFIDHGSIRFVDLGISVLKGEKCLPKGTAVYAAPEQLEGKAPEESFDIYAAGRVLEEILNFVTDNSRDFLLDVVERATSNEPSDRYATAREMKADICNKAKNITNKHIKKEHLGRIAVVGSSSGVGCSQLAIALTVYMNSTGIETYYVDRSHGRVLQNLKEKRPEMKSKDGVIYHRFFRGWTEYGPAVEALTPPTGLFIYDCGAVRQIPADVDTVVFVISNCPWKENIYPDFVNRSNCIVVANFATRVDSIKLAGYMRKNVYRYPMCANPFSVDKVAEPVLKKIASMCA